MYVPVSVQSTTYVPVLRLLPVPSRNPQKKLPTDLRSERPRQNVDCDMQAIHPRGANPRQLAPPPWHAQEHPVVAEVETWQSNLFSRFQPLPTCGAVLGPESKSVEIASAGG